MTYVMSMHRLKRKIFYHSFHMTKRLYFLYNIQKKTRKVSLLINKQSMIKFSFMNKLAFPYNANSKFVIIMKSCKICNETLFWVNCVSFNFVAISTRIFIFDFCVDIAIWVISATCDTKNKISQAICWIALGTRV